MNLPIKYKDLGLHVWCNKCKKVVTSKPCIHTDRQVFQSRIYNPITKRQDRVRSYKTKDPKEAYKLHNEYKTELENNNYEVVTTTETSINKPVFLLESIAMYCDWLRDVDLPSFQHKNHSTKHIATQDRHLSKFLKSLKPHFTKLADLPVTAIGEKEIGLFHEHLLSLNHSDATYNTVMKGVKYFFDYLIDKKGVDMVNPIQTVKMKSLYYSPEILTEAEIRKLFSVITEANGIGFKGRNNETVNYYRPWLKDAFLLCLLTGERRGGVVYLQGKHYQENHLVIPNRKVNHAKDTDKYKNYTYVTADLAELLLRLNIGHPDEYILCPDMVNRDTLANFMSRAFAHYWKQTGSSKEVSLKHLRSTYLTRMGDVLGEHSKMLKHTNAETMLKHYFNELEMVQKTSVKMKTVQLFDIS